MPTKIVLATAVALSTVAGVLATAAGRLHFDLGPSYVENTLGDRFHWYSASGWVMWNILLSGLVAGSAVVLYDGNPMAPKAERLWELAAETGMTLFGASPTFLNGQMKAGIRPNKLYDMSKMDSILLGGC